MRKEIAKKLNDGVLKHITIFACTTGPYDGVAELGVNCSKCRDSKTFNDEEVNFEDFLTDLILWAVSHECK